MRGKRQGWSQSGGIVLTDMEKTAVNQCLCPWLQGLAGRALGLESGEFPDLGERAQLQFSLDL